MKRLLKIGSYIHYAVGIGLLLCLVVVYLPPVHFGYLSILGLFTPVFLLLTILSLLYGLIRRRRWAIFSGVVLCLSWGSLGRWVQLFAHRGDGREHLSLLSFNVRLFNHYHWHPNGKLYEQIGEFFKKEGRDVIVLQEFYNDKRYYPEGYPYKAIVIKGSRNHIGLAIFSKKKILRFGSLQFSHTTNNGMYADIFVGKDTVRFYNLHLESLHLSAKEEDLIKEDKEELVGNISRRFGRQQEQVEVFLAHKAQCRYKMIVCGDFNNTAFSYVYRKIKGEDLNDAFVEGGRGFGRTFNFKRYPLRIDFILPDKRLEVGEFQTHYVSLSDHYPLSAKIVFP